MSRPPSFQAREAALLRLMRLHRNDYDRLYDEERIARGLEPITGRRARRIAVLKAKLARLEDAS